jgi:meiotically up-regulated gene 157 (Mug157) protein
MIKGLFKKQIMFILFDPYANAFNKIPLKSPWSNDITYKRDNMGNFENAMNPNLWERKFELDSIIFPLFSMSQYFLLTKDISVFKKIILCILWPFFIFIQLPIDIQALFSKNLGWKTIPHGDKGQIKA